MLIKVKKLIDSQKLLTRGEKILVACSGGPDSLSLLHILFELRKDYGIEIAVAHVDHMFRGKDSAEDAAFVREVSRKLGVEFFQTAIDVPRYIKESGISAQDAARFLRYQYLRSIAKKLEILK
jgi:tRNA(Ile)-lysidine synthase